MNTPRTAEIIGAIIILISATAMAVSLKRESVGRIKWGDKVKKVIKRYGQPKDKKGGELWAATGCKVWTYAYPSKGLNFEICHNVDLKETYVIGIHAYGKSKAGTSRGIRIGSAKAEVKKAYKDLKKMNDKIEGIEDEECRCAIYFTFADDKVTEILLSEMPE